MMSVAHIAGWEPHNLHDLAQVSWVGSVLNRSDPAQILMTAG